MNTVCFTMVAFVFSTADLVRVCWRREDEKGNSGQGGGLCCSAKSRLGNKSVDRRDDGEGLGRDLL